MKKAKYIGIIAGLCLISLVFAFGQIFAVAKIDVFYEKTPLFAKTEEVIDSSGISLGANIFSIDEKAASKNIAEFYTDGSVEVVDIERIFPNKVLIYIKERLPVFAIPIKGDAGRYVVTDESFFINIYRKDNEGLEDLIVVSGITVENTFNTPNIYKLNEIRKGINALGIGEEALLAFVESIVFSEDIARVYLRHYNNICLEIDITKDNKIISKIAEKYALFINAEIAERQNKVY